MANESEDIAFSRLEVCKYRYLQRLAKQMSLPCNVKKVELIEMIRAKKYCSERDLEAIINRVKKQRKVNAQKKKNKKMKRILRLKVCKGIVDSTSKSPPITSTHERPCHSEYVNQCSSKSPKNRMMNIPRPSVGEAGAPFLQKLKSDRVLRSFNSMSRPDYRILDETDCVVGVVKSRNTIKEIRHQEQIQQFQEIRHQEEIQQFQEIHHKQAVQSANMNVQTQQRPAVNALVQKGQLVPVNARPASGIYPLVCQANPPYQLSTVNVRQADGRICKIKAFIQRPRANTGRSRSPGVTMQDVNNYGVEHPTVALTSPEAIEPKIHEIDNSNGHPGRTLGNIVTEKTFERNIKVYKNRNQVPAVPKIISAPMLKETRYDPEIRDRNMEHARKMDYARNTSLKAIEPAKPITDLRNQYPNMSSLTDVLPNENYTQHTDRNQYPNMSSLTDVLPNENYTQHTDRNQYPIMPSLTDVLPNENYNQHTDGASKYSAYYQKQINAEQVTGSTVERLPRINEVFSQFNEEANKKYGQPLFVKASRESERVSMPMTMNVSNACLLESIHNFESQYLTNPPLCRITPPVTNSTFSTTAVPTAVEQSAAAQNNDHRNPYEQASAYQLDNETDQTRYDYGQPDVICDEDLFLSPSAIFDTRESLPSPEMLEDALEFISQDGDYMERIGMDVRVKCILCCEWTGARFILEYHLRNAHALEIQHLSSPLCHVQISIARSLNGPWSSQLLKYQDTMYALSALRDETSVRLALWAIPNNADIPPGRCKITVSHERLKQPLFYECLIKDVPESMPYEYGGDCFVLDLASLDLMPNSDNKLVNGVLVGNTGTIGITDLDIVELAVSIHFFD